MVNGDFALKLPKDVVARLAVAYVEVKDLYGRSLAIRWLQRFVGECTLQILEALKLSLAHLDSLVDGGEGNSTS